VGDVSGFGVVLSPLFGGGGGCVEDLGCHVCGMFVPPLFAFFAGDFPWVDLPEGVERCLVYWLWFFDYGYCATSAGGYRHQRGGSKGRGMEQPAQLVEPSTGGFSNQPRLVRLIT